MAERIGGPRSPGSTSISSSGPAENATQESKTQSKPASTPASSSRQAEGARAHATGVFKMLDITQAALKKGLQKTISQSRTGNKSRTAKRHRLQGLSTGAGHRAKKSNASSSRRAGWSKSTHGTRLGVRGTRLAATGKGISGAHRQATQESAKRTHAAAAAKQQATNTVLENTKTTTANSAPARPKLERTGAKKSLHSTSGSGKSNRGITTQSGVPNSGARRRHLAAKGYSGLTPYGTGNTKSEASAAYIRHDKTLLHSKQYEDGKDGYHAGSEFAVGEARARTFQYESGLGVGAQAEASLVRAKIGIEGRKGLHVGGAEVVGVSGQTHVEGMIGARTTAEAGISQDKNGLPAARVGAEVFVGARGDASASGEARLMGIGAEVQGSGYGMAGAQADGQVVAGLSGIAASGGAFAGAKVGTSGSASVAGVGASGSAEAWAGVGVKGEADASFRDGKLSFKLGAGAALGLGGATSAGFSWDLNKTVTDVGRLKDNASKLIQSEGKKLGSLTSSVQVGMGHASAGAANQAGRAFKSTAKTVQNTAQSAAKDVKKFSTSTAKTVQSGAKKVEKGVAVAAKKTEKAATTAAKTAGKAVTQTTKSVGKTASNAAKSVGKLFGF